MSKSRLLALTLPLALASCVKDQTKPAGVPPPGIQHAGIALDFPEVLTLSSNVVARRSDAQISYGVRQLRYAYPDGSYVEGQPLQMAGRKLDAGHRVSYASISSQTDLQYDFTEQGVEQLIILKDRSMLPAPGSADRLEIAEAVDFSGLDVEIDGVTPSVPFDVGTDHEITLKRGGTAVFRLPPPAIRDAAGQTSHVDARFELRLTAAGDGFLITKIPLALLQNDALAYPLSIDPAIRGACAANDGPNTCDDGNPCTADSCGGTGCLNTATNDGTRCWGTGTCNNGVCTFTGARPCGADADCNDAFACTNESCVAGACVSSNAAAGTPCGPGTGHPPAPGMGNDGRCDGFGICIPNAAGSGPESCNDGNPCTDDSGTAPNCVNRPNDANTCGTGIACRNGFCDWGAQAAGCQPKSCDDGSPCTDDTCSANASCGHTAAAQGTACAGGSGTCDGGGRCIHNDEPIACALEGQVVSYGGAGQPATTIAFVNNGSSTVYVFQISATGARILPPTPVPAGQTVQLNTRAGVKFLVGTSAGATGGCSGIYEASFVSNQVVIGSCNTAQTCGSDCQACPAAPANASYTCAGASAPAATACTVTCNAGFALSNGACVAVCSNGNLLCGSSCVDPNSDNSNCGACDNICMSGTSCSAGMCCTAGLSGCGGVCKDLSADNANCGVCGSPCGSSERCVSGVCENAACLPPAVTNNGCQQVLLHEDWETDPSARWGFLNGSSGIVTTTDSSACHSRFLRETILYSAGRLFSRPGVAVTPGQTYCFSGWIRGSAGTAPFIGMRASNSAGTLAGSENWLIGDPCFGTGLGTPVSPVKSNGQWHWYSRQFTMPNYQYVIMELELWGGRAPGTADFDELQIVHGSCPSSPPVVCSAATCN